jgi:hypothetical protein
MSEKQPEKPVIADSDIARGLQAMAGLGVPSEVVEVIALRAALAAEVEASSPRYLELPSRVAVLAADWWYTAALSHGRLAYREAMYDDDERTDELLYWPIEYSREEIYVFLRDMVLAHERPLMLMKLSWRVGFCVGWLSGLAVAQKDDAQAGLVLLAALLAPLVSGVPQEKRKGSRTEKRRSLLKEGNR